MMPRYDRVRLVDFSDRRYKHLRTRHMSFWKASGSGPTARDLFSKDAERTLRRFVASQLRLTTLRIINYYEQAGISAVEPYRERICLPS